MMCWVQTSQFDCTCLVQHHGKGQESYFGHRHSEEVVDVCLLPVLDVWEGEGGKEAQGPHVRWCWGRQGNHVSYGFVESRVGSVSEWEHKNVLKWHSVGEA